MAQDNVTFTKPELTDALNDYEVINDVLSGERKFKKDAIKKGYIRVLNPNDDSTYNQELNARYLDSAILFPFALNTLNGLSQMVFTKDPKIELTPELEYLRKNANGSNVGLIQLMKKLNRQLLSKGRCVLWVDATVNNDKSAAAKPMAYINMTMASNAINWRDDVNGLQMTVFKEQYAERGTFAETLKDRWRVLVMLEGVYHVQTWVKTDNGYKMVSNIAPTDFNGNTWGEIPCVFAGSESNDTAIDMPPLLEIIRLNVKHFKNSADYEHAAFWAGQPQPYMSGLDQNWLDTVINPVNEDGTAADGAFEMGSSSVLPLPEGGEFGFAQAEPNTMPMEAMKHKEENFIRLGAKLIEKGGANTKVEAGQNASTEASILSNVALNSEQAMNMCLGWVSRFMQKAQDDENNKIELNKEFINKTLTAQEITAIVSAWQGGAITDEALVKIWQRYNIEDPNKQVEEIIDELQANSSGLGLGNDNAE